MQQHTTGAAPVGGAKTLTLKINHHEKVTIKQITHKRLHGL